MCAEFFPVDPPAFYAIPFSFHNVPEIRQLLIATGFTRVEIETIKLYGESPSATTAARGTGSWEPGRQRDNGARARQARRRISVPLRPGRLPLETSLEVGGLKLAARLSRLPKSVFLLDLGPRLAV